MLLFEIKGHQPKSFDPNALATAWTAIYSEECAAFANTDDQHSKNGSFAEMYHSLIHSSALESILDLEHTYSICIDELLREFNTSQNNLLQWQAKKMEEAVEKVNSIYSDKDINDLATKQFYESQSNKDLWTSRICNEKRKQKEAFHAWLSETNIQHCKGVLHLNRKDERLDKSNEVEDVINWQPQNHKLEESFTIHLGSQLKVMHNLRLLSTNVLDLCSHKTQMESLPSKYQPQRLQMAMSLYSSSLSGLVLLVDNRVNSFTGIKQEFSNVCQQSTEFHFLDLDEQMNDVRKGASYTSRLKAGKTVEDQSSLFLKPGDIYVTRHSNLSEVHVVFHLVVDDSLVSMDINSRHPAILGLRQILRVAHEWDVRALSIPLLLAHDMAEEMTIAWCLKRAELVFKCIKGFMIEMASMTGEETHTVQFLVPKGISEDFFHNLLTMLPGIFRVSNPLILLS